MRRELLVAKTVKYSQTVKAGEQRKPSTIIEQQRVRWVLDRNDARDIARCAVQIWDEADGTLAALCAEIDREPLDAEGKMAAKQHAARVAAKLVQEELDLLGRRYQLESRIVIEFSPENVESYKVSIPDKVTDHVEQHVFEAVEIESA